MLLLCRNLGYILKTSLHVSHVDYVTDHNPNQERKKLKKIIRQQYTCSADINTDSTGWRYSKEDLQAGKTLNRF